MTLPLEKKKITPAGELPSEEEIARRTKIAKARWSNFNVKRKLPK